MSIQLPFICIYLWWYSFFQTPTTKYQIASLELLNGDGRIQRRETSHITKPAYTSKPHVIDRYTHHVDFYLFSTLTKIIETSLVQLPADTRPTKTDSTVKVSLNCPPTPLARPPIKCHQGNFLQNFHLLGRSGPPITHLEQGHGVNAAEIKRSLTPPHDSPYLIFSQFGWLSQVSHATIFDAKVFPRF